jgi:signal transduction histidine kinase
MTETTVQHPIADSIATSIGLPESLAQENARLRRQLDDLNARFDQIVDERLADLVTLHESDQQIHARLDAEHVLNAVLDWVMLVTAAVAGALYLVVDPPPHTQEPKTLRAVAQRGYWPPMDLDEPLQWPTGQDILARALETGQPVRQAHVCDEVVTGPSQHNADRSHLAIPVRHAHQPAVGVFALESALADGFTAAQIDLATRLADDAALAIQNALRFQEADRRAASLQSVHQSSLHLASRPESIKLPQTIVSSALECLDIARAALYQYDSATDDWSLAAASSRDADQLPDADPSEQTLAQDAADSKTAHWARDPAGARVVALPLPTENVLANTVQIDVQVRGVLLLSLTPSSSPSSLDVEPLYLYADRAAIALQHAERLAHLERSLYHQREHANRMVDQSRAPLTAVQGYTKLLLQQIGGDLTGRQREFLETILKNASQLETLLNKQLDRTLA